MCIRDSLYRSFNLIEVKDIFVDVLEEYDYSIHESMFPMLILHAGTSIERMNCANYINMEEGCLLYTSLQRILAASPVSRIQNSRSYLAVGLGGKTAFQAIFLR